MIPKPTVDLRDMQAGMRFLAQHGKETATQIVNQTTFDIAADMANALLPPDTQSKQIAIRNYMETVIAQRVRQIKSGKRKGKFTARARRGASKGSMLLKRKHLIAQARRKMAGLGGLYGREMARYAGALAGRARRSVGYLGVILNPVLMTLVGLVKYKVSVRSLFRNVARWPGSRGYGKINVATVQNPNALMNLGWNLGGPRESYARALIMNAFLRARTDKLASIRRKCERLMADMVAKSNRRRSR